MRKYFARIENCTIGSCQADVIIPDFPGTVWIEGDQCTIKKGLGIPLRWNGRDVSETEQIESGDELEWETGKWTFLEQGFRLDTTEEISSTLLEQQPKEAPFEGYPKYKRSPRLIKRVVNKEITLSKPKEDKKGKQESLVQLILPPLIMLVITIGISILMKRGLYVIMSAAGTAMTTIFSVTKFITEKKEAKEDRRLREETYHAYLLRKRKEIYRAYKAEEEANRYNYPDIQALEQMVHAYSPRIYERSSNDEDFLSVSLGQADVSCHFKIKLAKEELTEEKDALLQEAEELKREFSRNMQPIVVDLKKAHLGLVGEKDVIHEQLKLLVAQLTFFQSYHDLEIVTIYHDKYDADFQWMRWYPHLRIHTINVVATVNSERKRDQILGSLHQMLKNRKSKLEESKKESRFLPHILFIIDEPKLIMDHSIMEYLDREGDNLGFSIIYTTNIRANLPENIGTIVMLDKDRKSVV